MKIFEELLHKLRSGDALTRLLFVNILFFFVLQVYYLILFLNGAKAGYTGTGEFLFLDANSSPAVMLTRPWSLITHMFTHAGIAHFFFNMVMLYMMGKMFTDFHGSKRLPFLYIAGGLSGYILFALSYNLFAVFRTHNGSDVLGASAAVIAITVATATLNPKKEVYLFGAVKLQLMWLAIILVLLDLASVRTGVNSGGRIGHLGGAVFGFIYARQLQKGKMMGGWFDRFMDKIKSLFSKQKMTVASNNGRPKSDEQFNLEKKARQKKVDEILDRISRSGYESLSKDEKEFLFRNSQQ